MRPSSIPSLLIAILILSASFYAQQVTAVPRLIRFNGSYRAASQQTRTPTVGVTFSIYRDQYDGTPLWSEIQNVQPDNDGNYAALLGSTRSEGMPVDLFTTTEPRWLEVEIGRRKEPRILLATVPYAVKAIDADTLGGLPASAYLHVSPAVAAGSAGSMANSSSVVVATGVTPLANNGSANCIGMFLNTTDLICSAMNQSVYQGNPAVSFGLPVAYLGAITLIGNVPAGDAAGIALYNAGGGPGSSVSLDMYNTPFNSGIPQAKIKAIDDGAYSDNLTFWTKTPGAPGNPITEKLRIASTGNIGIATIAPAFSLDVNGMGRFVGGIVFGDGTTQTTAATSGGGGGGGGTITSVNAGIGLTGGGTSGAVTLNLNTTLVPLLNAVNTFTGNQTVNGNLNLSGIIQSANGVAIFQVPPPPGIGGPNLAVGYGALPPGTTGEGGNVAIGTFALSQNRSGFGNTAVGISALANGATGNNNTAVGNSALLSTTTNQNTAVGAGALLSNSTGGDNTAVGYGAMGSASRQSGGGNVALGSQALSYYGQFSNNTAVGYLALPNSPGSNNVALGAKALGEGASLELASNNVAVGAGALGGLTAGSSNTAIGYNSGAANSSGSNNVYIANPGNSAVPGIVGEDNIMRIGTPGIQTSTFIAGISGVNVSGVPVLVSASGQLGVASSSRRYKKDIQDMGSSTDNLMRLRPVTYRYKQPFEDGSQPIQYGLIAEEVAALYPELVARSGDGKIETVKYQALDTMLLNEVQKQNATITAQQKKIQSLEERLSRLESLLERASSVEGSQQR